RRGSPKRLRREGGRSGGRACGAPMVQCANRAARNKTAPHPQLTACNRFLAACLLHGQLGDYTSRCRRTILSWCRHGGREPLSRNGGGPAQLQRKQEDGRKNPYNGTRRAGTSNRLR